MQGQPSEFRSRFEELLESCGLPAEVAAEIEDRLTPVTYEKGAVIFVRGDHATFFSGFLKDSSSCTCPTRTVIGPWSTSRGLATFSDLSMTEIPRVAATLLEAHALTKCSVGLFTRDQIVPILNKLDNTGTIDLLEQLNVAWSAMFERYVSFLGSPFRTRLEMVFNSLGARFGINDKRGTLLVPELSHEDLAEMIGSSRPMVSKLIGDMTREGLLARSEKRHFILRPKQSTSAVTPADVRSSVQWNGASKQAVGASDHARARQSQTFPSRSQNGSNSTMFK